MTSLSVNSNGVDRVIDKNLSNLPSEVIINKIITQICDLNLSADSLEKANNPQLKNVAKELTSLSQTSKCFYTLLAPEISKIYKIYSQNLTNLNKAIQYLTEKFKHPGFNMAIVEGNVERVKAFIKAGQNVNECTARNGNIIIPLQLAIASNKIDVVRLLLDQTNIKLDNITTEDNPQIETLIEDCRNTGTAHA